MARATTRHISYGILVMARATTRHISYGMLVMARATTRHIGYGILVMARATTRHGTKCAYRSLLACLRTCLCACPCLRLRTRLLMERSSNPPTRIRKRMFAQRRHVRECDNSGTPRRHTTIKTPRSRHRRWHVHCAGMSVPVLKMTASLGRSF